MEIKSNIDAISLINSKVNNYDFFQAVRIIDNRIENEGFIGSQFHPQQELINFIQNPSFKTAISDISRCRFNSKNDKIEIVTNFIAILGSSGIMPFFFTEHILRQMQSKNLSMLHFLNIFHNRMISFLYRAWAINNQTVSYEKKRDKISKYLYSIIGHDYKHKNTQHSLHSDFKLYFAAHFASSEQSTESLSSIIREYYNINVKIEEFVETYLELPHEEKIKLVSSNPSACLGNNTFIGDEISICTTKFKLILGPMTLDKYNSILPGTIGFSRLKEILLLCSPPELHYDIEYLLSPDKIPFESESAKPQLGYNMWLISEKPKQKLQCLYLHNYKNIKEQIKGT